ncbi:hypothetical protein ACJIZ3_016545 [Penstemon smallii]|uniref:RING-type E3 ubiquitin transferase n=1 Tax=Penstemon smallii TaxID=265156 RepID=A0ABD3SU25_9LAMI
MDDSCAVCAESLEWVAYGACGHKDVCSTCVARLRFICGDRRCCICKTESSVVFVTKALGDYTKTISDFSLLPSEVKEGRVGQYCYHEDTQTFFDDVDHYKMIKAMCRLSCSLCDRMEDQPNDGSRRRARFRNVEQLKGHLFHKHRLLMCSLCLEGRKIFICEQKLYSRSELSQHINTGDSEVDGTESERGGFMGHPSCEFCLSPFYGDNELYTHMSTEHYTCHICQRRHPGQYEYYKDYDDLEVHFRHDHFLCEDEGCLAKKFTVFQSESELKRHNTMEHGGNMSRSKRSAALQIPTSFRYNRSSEQNSHRRRGLTFRRDLMDNELSLAIQASLETANVSLSSSQTGTDHRRTTDVETLILPFESLATSESERPSRYLQVVSQYSTSGTLEESSFPPLQVAPGSNQQNSQRDSLRKKTMAAHLRRQSNRKTKASSSSPAWPAASRAPTKQVITTSQPAMTPFHDWPSVNGVSGSASSSGPRIEIGTSSSNHPYSAQSCLPSATNSSFSGSLVSSKTFKIKSQINHSSSAPNLSERGSLEYLHTDFPPVSAAQTRKLPATDKSVVKVKDVHTANKSLVERMRIALGFDEEKFTAFKVISGEYRQDSMDAETYLAYVEQFGLSHLVIEMARLLPNAQKQKQLIETYNLNLSYDTRRENGWNNVVHVNNSNGSKKGKGKSVDSGNRIVKKSLADNMISQMKELQSSTRASEEEVEVLSKDGYRDDRGKSKVVIDDSQVELKGQIESSSAAGGANQNIGTGNGKGKQRKKTSKFHRVRLGEDSIEAVLDLKNTDPDPDPGLNSKGANYPLQSLPARSVWQNGGGRKLLGVASRVNKNRV